MSAFFLLPWKMQVVSNSKLELWQFIYHIKENLNCISCNLIKIIFLNTLQMFTDCVLLTDWISSVTALLYTLKAFKILLLFIICKCWLCFQLVQLPNWLPDVFSQASGMEVARLSYLGPFFALSVFAEDNVSNHTASTGLNCSYHGIYFVLLKYNKLFDSL